MDSDRKSDRGDRIFGERASIDYGDTLKFFNERARRVDQVGFLSAVLYQDKNPDLALARDQLELKQALPLLPLGSTIRVLDIGCGVGRWAHHLGEKVGLYHGVDFSSELIAVADRAWQQRASRACVSF